MNYFSEQQVGSFVSVKPERIENRPIIPRDDIIFSHMDDKKEKQEEGERKEDRMEGEKQEEKRGKPCITMEQTLICTTWSSVYGEGKCIMSI